MLGTGYAGLGQPSAGCSMDWYVLRNERVRGQGQGDWGSGMSDSQSQFKRIIVAIKKPIFSPAGVIHQTRGDLIRAGFKVDEFQFFHVVLPQLMTNEPYIALIAADLLDLNDYMNSDRAAVIQMARLLPQSIFIIWDKLGRWKVDEESSPPNVLVWTDSETNMVTTKIFKLLRHSME